MKIEELTPKELILYTSTGLFLASWAVLILGKVMKEIKKFLK